MTTVCLSRQGRGDTRGSATFKASQFSCPALGLPLPCSVLTNIDPPMLHRSRDGPKQPTPKAQALVVEVSHDLMTFTVDARGSKGTCHQG